MSFNKRILKNRINKNDVTVYIDEDKIGTDMGLEKAISVWKRKVKKSGKLYRLKKKSFYVKPSEQKKIEERQKELIRRRKEFWNQLKEKEKEKKRKRKEKEQLKKLMMIQKQIEQQ